jgi:hypothetical protein
MNRSSRPFRTPANLSESMNQRLSAYALVAGAAGVGVLALTPPAEGKIVYTPANVKIVWGDHVPLDLNHDGLNDFIFTNYSFSAATFISFLRVGGAVKGNAVVVQSHGKRLPAAFKAGRLIGPNKPFTSYAQPMAGYCVGGGTYTCHSFFGPWANGGKGVKNRYVGLRFAIKGRVHYGWARLTVSMGPPTSDDIVGHLTGYAYETIPNKPIVTGMTKEPAQSDNSVEQPNPSSLATPTSEPSTLGVLAMGAQRLSSRRRESLGSLP